MGATTDTHAVSEAAAMVRRLVDAWDGNDERTIVTLFMDMNAAVTDARALLARLEAS